MSKPDDGGPGFPSHARAVTDAAGDTVYELRSEGLSLRDYFAGQAIACFRLSDSDVQRLVRGESPGHQIAARFCYGFADAMLEQRALR